MVSRHASARSKSIAVILAGIVGVAAFVTAASAAQPDSATIRFGLPNAGSPFPPGSGHDQSTHAKDSMVPRTVVIPVGGTVTFQVAPIHRVAICDPGITPDDVIANIEDGVATLVDLIFPFEIPNFTIDDPNCPIDPTFPVPELDQLSPVPLEWSTPPFLFPGRYLVICTTTPHFLDNDMYGWIIVE